VKVTTVKMPEDLLWKLDFWAKTLKVSRSELIRRAVKHYIKVLEAEYGLRRGVKIVRLES